MTNKFILPSYEIDISDSLNWRFILIHHSLTKDGNLVDWATIDHYHRTQMGMVCIGYNFGIERIGGKLIFHCGRPLNMLGAHCRGMNDKAIGFLFTGNFDLAPPDEETLLFSIPFLKAIMYAFQIPPEHIKGHRSYAIKTCPGKLFPLDKLREMLI